MLADLKELYRYRSLLITMVRRELRIRYKNSILGFVWSMLNPLLTVTVLTVVFKYINGNTTPNYSAYALAAYLPYMFFQMAVMDSCMSVLQSIQLVKKIYFPREILPLTSIISNFIHFVLALGVFFFYLLVIALWHHDWSMFVPTVAWLPVLLFFNFLLAAGLGFLFSAVNTFYEDVKYMVGVAFTLLFFLSPIMYMGETTYYSGMAPHYHYGKFFLYHLNPIAAYSTAFRDILLPRQPIHVTQEYPIGSKHYFNFDATSLPIDWRVTGIAMAVSVLVFVYGYYRFNKVKWKFVERP